MFEISKINVVILAGGLGTRLRSVANDQQKVTINVSGRPFLTYILEQLSVAGVREVILCTGYKSESVRKILGNNYKLIKIRYSKENEALGTGGAVRNALPLINSDPVIILNGDSYIDFSLKIYMNWFFECDRLGSMLLTKVPDAKRYGKVKVDENERIISFKEKEKEKESDWINAGIYIIRKTIINSIPVLRKFSLERQFFPDLVGRGLYGFRCEGKFIDIGTPESHQYAEHFFAMNNI